MPIVLVVDDSAVDRKLIEGILRPKLDWIVEFAEDGAKGLQMIDQMFPDVVITDLQMPGMNGIELCATAKTEYPQVPIVLITGKGSEDLAVQALAAGATSYVPKSALSVSLLETVEQVLALAHQTKSRDFFQKYNTSSRYQFTIPNDPKLIADTVDFLKGNMERLNLGDQAERRHCAVALEEAILNGMFHGNLQLGYDGAQDARRAMHDGYLSEIVQERLNQPTCRERKIKIAIEFSRRDVKIIVRDDGSGFDVKKNFGAANDHQHFSQNIGRGLTLIRNFMEDVQFNDAGNEVRMHLKLESSAKPSVTERDNLLRGV